MISYLADFGITMAKKYLGTTLREDPVHMLAAPFSDGDFRQNIKEKAQ